MNNDEYNKFLLVACDIAAVATKDGVEFMDSMDGIKLDDESRLMLCISSPDRLDTVDKLLSDFNNKYATCLKKEKTV